MLVYCPFCPGKRLFTDLRYLKTHVRMVHPANGYCPLCGRRVKNISKHAYERWVNGDEEHAVIYYLYCPSHTWYYIKSRDVRIKARKIAEKILSDYKNARGGKTNGGTCVKVGWWEKTITG